MFPSSRSSGGRRWPLPASSSGRLRLEAWRRRPRSRSTASATTRSAWNPAVTSSRPGNRARPSAARSREPKGTDLPVSPGCPLLLRALREQGVDRTLEHRIRLGAGDAARDLDLAAGLGEAEEKRGRAGDAGGLRIGEVLADLALVRRGLQALLERR